MVVAERGNTFRLAEQVDDAIDDDVDVVEELLVPHGVREMRKRFGDAQRLRRT
jgi:hypothetical protein